MYNKIENYNNNTMIYKFLELRSTRNPSLKYESSNS